MMRDAQAAATSPVIPIFHAQSLKGMAWSPQPQHPLGESGQPIPQISISPCVSSHFFLQGKTILCRHFPNKQEVDQPG